MDSIRRAAKVARRRLTISRFFALLPTTLSVALLIAIVGLLMPKIVSLPVDSYVWYLSWVAASATMGLLMSFVLSLVGRPSIVDAAVEVDHRFALRERLASALMLPRQDRETELGGALVNDAVYQASRIDVRDRFDFGISRRLLLPIIPALLTLSFWYIPNRSLEADAQEVTSSDVTRVKNSTKPLIEQIKKKRLEAEQRNQNEAAERFKQLEMELSKLQKDSNIDAKKSLAKLNDIRDQLNERRKQLGGGDALKKDMQNLKKLDSGPGDKLADALKNGDFEKAQRALEELLGKMSNGELSAEDSKQLQTQLEQLEKALNEATANREKAKQALQEQIRQAESAGDLQKSAQLQRKLAELEAADANTPQMQEMASLLSQAQQAMQEGDSEAAQQSLGQIAEQLQQMNQADSELQELDELLDSLSMSKSQMACSQCNGSGCQSCMGMDMMSGNMTGTGVGDGRGQNTSLEDDEEGEFFESRVRDQMKAGETVYGGKVGGENRKGTTRIEVQDSVLTSLSEEPEPLDDTPLPKTRRDHAREYFNAIREGN